MELLRSHDAFFLYTENSRVQQHLGGLILVEPSEEVGAVRLVDLRDRLAARVHQWPRLRHRLAFPLIPLARPVWVDDPGFDLDRHLKRADLPDPGGWRALEDRVAQVMARPLPRDRPLWEVHLIDGLEGGRQAILIKMHHAIADGLAAIYVVTNLLLDPTPRVELPAPRPWRPRDVPGRWALLLWAVGEQFRVPAVAVARGARVTVRSPRDAFRQTLGTAVGVWNLARSGQAAPSILNRPIGTRRRVVLTDVPIDAIREVRRLHGGTVNDVVLALAAEAIHRLLRERGIASSEMTIRATVPVSIRLAGAEHAPGTWTSAFSADLPVGPMAPSRRLAEIQALTRKIKSSHQALASHFVMSGVGDLAPPPLHAWASRWAYRGRWFNLIVTSLPGPRDQLYLAGARVVRAYPLVPLVEDVGLTFGAMTWHETMTFGLTADPDVVSGLDWLPRLLEQRCTQLRIDTAA